ncbi:hypothetical protein HO173_011514 [Letharia columbiana]|uniref:Uncharacterized protein n=1 Tax=Letharia columbiana TaxID=112416 RepID=A0A8H6FJ64_9LECA|nr:uncharacterized protein HO173_011514 [Letharia columbiana]KAF6229474.1 hypothetical protein HO173_011514 [Letharia columbiana]
MASQFFKMMRSLFYQQSTKQEKANSFHTINGVFGDWATSAVEDVPPPYTESPEGKTHFQDEKDILPPPFAGPCLQICPHEALSFEDLKNTISSTAMKNHGEIVDALTLGCHEPRSQFDLAAVDPKHVCVSSPSSLRGFGTYASHVGKEPARAPGIMLSFQWDLGWLDGVRAQVETAAELQQFLNADGIWLCPHKRINDSDIVNAIYGFVKRPLGREVLTGCDSCDTEITILARREGNDETCRVTTRRYLGAVETPDDPIWLAQCGV